MLSISSPANTIESPDIKQPNSSLLNYYSKPTGIILWKPYIKLSMAFLYFS